jgi:hypothetical protein
VADPLASLSLPELEALYRGPLGPAPVGEHIGELLTFVESRGGRDRRYRALSTAMFRWPRWGVDFDRRLWWFGGRRLALGRFRVVLGRSRWRDAEVLQLHYDDSRLPGGVRARLYDEIKPLADGRILGIGGIVERGDPLDIFFLALQPR